jgi:hypothetical protein
VTKDVGGQMENEEDRIYVSLLYYLKDDLKHGILFPEFALDWIQGAGHGRGSQPEGKGRVYIGLNESIEVSMSVENQLKSR